MLQACQRGIASKFTFRYYLYDLCLHAVYFWILITDRISVTLPRITFPGLSAFQGPPMWRWFVKVQFRVINRFVSFYQSSSSRQHRDLYIKGLLLSLLTFFLIQQCGANWEGITLQALFLWICVQMQVNAQLICKYQYRQLTFVVLWPQARKKVS